MDEDNKSVAPGGHMETASGDLGSGFSDISSEPFVFDDFPLLHNDAFLSTDTKEIRDFVVGRFVSLVQFNNALAQAEAAELPVDYVLVMSGYLNAESYFSALAKFANIAFINESKSDLLLPFADEIYRLKHSSLNNILLSSSTQKVLIPWGMGPSRLFQYKHHMESNSWVVMLTCPAAVRRALLKAHQDRLLTSAVHHLNNSAPDYSAYNGFNFAQIVSLVIVFGGLAIGFSYSPLETGLLLASVLSSVFFFLISLRLAATFHSLPNPMEKNSIDASQPLTDKELPIYTLMVPLFRESDVVHQLITALKALDYPTAKLDIKLLLEEVDQETITSIKSLNLPPYFDLIIIPHQGPQTKPKALNYGLEFARGDFVVIYDAEDIPEVDQLKLALIEFRKGPPSLASLQAKLNIYNFEQNWWTKQFTVEYSSLFDWMLPFFSAVDLPIPLGGTSNHFKRNVLEETGSWDPYNVTEDADLGIRLYRHGFKSKMLASTTYEEACSSFSSWLNQRTRWLKGWMQTYIVHMRSPLRLWQQLGTWRFIGFQAIFGAPVLSFLVHPFFLGFLIFTTPFDQQPQSVGMAGLWSISMFNLASGYLSSMLLGFFALRRRRYGQLVKSLFFIPLYWMAISFAAYCALFQLLVRPFYWEKTQHYGMKSMNRD